MDLGPLGMDRGGHLLVKRALAAVEVGTEVGIRGDDAALGVHLRAWARSQGHGFLDPGILIRGSAQAGRWRGAHETGQADPAVDGAVADNPPGVWGLAGRSASVEAGSPDFQFPLSDKDVVWADEVPRLYAQAAASQWDPEAAIPWDAPADHPPEVEDALVQIMTYLVENETVALLVPARFLGRIHPHFREVMQLLAIQAADEARHIEVFTRRALLRRPSLALSASGGQHSLKTLLDEPDFALAFFLLSVLGEGTFLSLLWFIHEHAPDEATRVLTRLAAQDEARHVAFGMAHIRRHLSRDPGLESRLIQAVRRRHDVLANTAGLNEEVFDALVVLAAGSWAPEAIGRGFEAVVALNRSMGDARRRRLQKLGFHEELAGELSALHTRNFM